MCLSEALRQEVGARRDWGGRPGLDCVWGRRSCRVLSEALRQEVGARLRVGREVGLCSGDGLVQGRQAVHMECSVG